VTYAFGVGSGREFAMQAFRDAFQGGAELSVAEHVFESAARAGLDEASVRAEVQDPEIKRALREATDRAYDLGVFGVPTIAIGDELFWGDDRLEDAAAHLATCST
jgi:2-hydroxychromene-2-carboxylate isomerase